MRVCSTCSGHGLNGGMQILPGRYIKSSRGQRFVGITELVHEIIDGSSYSKSNAISTKFS